MLGRGRLVHVLVTPGVLARDEHAQVGRILPGVGLGKLIEVVGDGKEVVLRVHQLHLEEPVSDRANEPVREQPDEEKERHVPSLSARKHRPAGLAHYPSEWKSSLSTSASSPLPPRLPSAP